MRIIKVELVKNDKEKKRLNLDSISKSLGILAAAAGICFTALQYYNSEKWQKGEFIRNAYKEFSNDSSTKLIQKILDYNGGIQNYQYGDSFITINPSSVKVSLKTDYNSYVGITQVLRDAFDSYFDNLSVFNRDINAGLMSFNELKPYLQYYIRAIADTTDERQSIEIQKEMWKYLSAYKFDDVQQLCCRYGYNVISSKKDSCSCIKPFF